MPLPGSSALGACHVQECHRLQISVKLSELLAAVCCVPFLASAGWSCLLSLPSSFLVGHIGSDLTPLAVLALALYAREAHSAGPKLADHSASVVAWGEASPRALRSVAWLWAVESMAWPSLPGGSPLLP